MELVDKKFLRHPASIIFVRNDHGSHNPDETMAMEDFALGSYLVERAGRDVGLHDVA